MPQKEKVFVEWICDHIYVIFAVGATIVSIIIRISMRHYTSDDMTRCLLPWFETILNHGGLNALGTQVGNYNMPYQSLIAVMTYIPLNPQYLYKISSCAFDYIIGFFAAQVTYDITKNIGKSIATYGMLINLPIVLFNSALWGQCDSIYSAFCLISLYLIFKKKYTLSFIAYGISMAFKLQAIFLLPFLIYVYIHKKEFSVSKFLWIPLMMIVLSLGGILQGQPIVRVFGIYLEQAHDRAMSVNYPSFWALMMENWPETDEFIHDMKVYAIMLAVLVPGAMFTVLLHIKKRSLSDGELLKIAFLSVYAIVFLLPNMHERYGYLYIIFGFIVSIIDRKTTLIYVFLLSIDIVIYSHYLFGIEVQWQVLAMGNLICFAVYSYYILSSVLREQRCFEK